MRQRHMRNENGAVALLSVLVMSFVVVTTLSTVYVYIINRAKYHGRIKEAYQVTHVMEEFGKLSRQAYDTGVAVGATAGGTQCPGGRSPLAVGSMLYCFPPCTPSLLGTSGCVSGHNLCVTHLGKPYCLDSTPNGGSASYDEFGRTRFEVVSLDAKTNENENIVSKSLNKWFARLDNYFDVSKEIVPRAANKAGDLLSQNVIPEPTFLGWVLPSKAYAKEGLTSGGVTGIVPTTNTTGTEVTGKTSTSGGITGRTTLISTTGQSVGTTGYTSGSSGKDTTGGESDGRTDGQTTASNTSTLPTPTPPPHSTPAPWTPPEPTAECQRQFDENLPISLSCRAFCLVAGSGTPGGGSTTTKSHTSSAVAAGDGGKESATSLEGGMPPTPGGGGVSVRPGCEKFASALNPINCSAGGVVPSACQTCVGSSCLQLSYCMEWDGANCSIELNQFVKVVTN